MGIDAVLLLRPKSPRHLRGVLDPDQHSVTVLDDGALLLSTFLRYGDVENDPAVGLRILRSYPGLIEAHDDPRGVLFIPDVCDPRGATYEAVVEMVGTGGIWIPTRELSEAERAALRRPPPKLPDFSPENMFAKLPLTGSIEDLLAEAQTKLANGANNPLLEDALKTLANLQEIMSNPEAFRGEESLGALLLQRPSRRPLGADDGGLGVNSCTALADGSLVIDTYRAGSDAHEMIALALGEQAREWVSEHTDPRGVPVFRRSAIEGLLSAATYDEAVARLGAEVRFVKPHTIDDVIDERKERFRRYLAG